MFNPVKSALLALPLLLISALGQAVEIPSEQSEFAEYVAIQVQQALPEVEVVQQDAFGLQVGELQVSLERIFASCEDDQHNCALELENFVNTLIEVYHDQSPEFDPAKVLLIVRSEAYLMQARESLGKDQAGPLNLDYIDGLALLPVLDLPTRVQSVSAAALPSINLTKDEVFALGYLNMQTYFSPLDEVAAATAEGEVGVIEEDFYASTRLIQHKQWAKIAKAQQGDLLVAVPATNQLFYLTSANQEAAESLKLLISDVYQNVPNPLSDKVYKWVENGWEVVR